MFSKNTVLALDVSFDVGGVNAVVYSSAVDNLASVIENVSFQPLVG
jgi:hypothetical protein